MAEVGEHINNPALAPLQKALLQAAMVAFNIPQVEAVSDDDVMVH
jgi:hypothetical protein